ncbi:branched-chain amino acid aminotransferase [Allofranklinella schreckenbergeri]|uniref:Branched-chain-amino-acid aminotransferase n=2 Tax=Allofranklinella schreckenbergeri TaxID=1076744 RepID=A0A3M6R5F9_9BURK|nr:branched-chain amino acid aminotransferase [Allofranklinella schreckenbergeri]RMX10385.1 branched-chain amino acid aminotransferase [Allofranklinella schreckenbergeri]RRD42547.1 branched-chain amino acid aminotransferase [Comamonadaceae bacterium OH3737_COT-264]
MPMPLSIHPTDTPTSAAERQAILDKGGFGTAFTDHMVTIEWTEGQGWHNAQVRKREPFRIDPAAAVLHYAQEVFEGMKAYRGEGDTITLFRPDQNAKRFNASAQRMAMPTLPEDVFVEAVQALVRTDRDWIPGGNGSLYLRPFMFADEPFLGVRPAHHFTFCVIASPVGDYFKSGPKPVKVWVSREYTRAAEGGTGAAKCGGNYAASLVAQAQAYENGCEQVVFLDAAEHQWIEELGGMNIFFVKDDGNLLTTPLGTILPGITRASLIELARSKGLTVEERKYSFDEWRADVASGKVKEVFACGTAAVVASIGEVKFEGGSFQIGQGESGPVTNALREELTALQRGKIADTRGWVRVVS